MERFLTDKAAKGRPWDIPALAASGIFTAAGVSVAFERLSAMPDDLFIEILACGITLAALSAPIWTYLRRRGRQAKARAIAKCLADSGQSSLTLGALERRTRIRGVKDVVKKLIAKGFLRNVELDEAHGMLRLYGEPEKVSVKAAAPVMDTGSAAYNETLLQIRELNDRIADYNVSQKIDRIEELTGGIFRLITERPEKAADARRFINYYLPTTMKLLESYDLLEEQRYQGENITASRRQIEGILDKLIQAIERQQDKLFQSDALDVEAEITVLETMMTADGLTGPEHGLRL